MKIKCKYAKYTKYAKYAKYAPVFSSWSEKIDSLDSIFKVRKGSVHTPHMPNCAVEHEIIVFACHSTFVHSFRCISLGLWHGWWAHELVVLVWPTEICKICQKMLNMNNMSIIKYTYLSNMRWAIVTPRWFCNFAEAVAGWKTSLWNTAFASFGISNFQRRHAARITPRM